MIFKSIFNKIKNNLISPHKVPIKLYLVLEKKIYNFFFLLRQENKKILNYQNKIFKKNNFNRDLGYKLFSKLKSQYKFLKKPMNSEHQILFCAISSSHKKNINSILEIGTFDGTNAFLLASIFPDAKITTLDLEDENEIFKNTYDRNSQEKRKNFIKERNKLLSLKDNITFLQKNSLSLTMENQYFDLIWVDGSHAYPEVAIDISNAIRMSKKNSLILCDDIYINKILGDKMYNSYASFETINHFSQAGLIDYNLFYKRLDTDSNSITKKRKYVSLIKLK